MNILSRRSFLTWAGAAAAAGRPGRAAAPLAGNRVHPLEGVGRENLKITDVKVALLSYRLPPDRQWLTARYVTWKTDEILVQVFTDKGIVGIGSSTQYGGPEAVKRFIEDYIRPAILGQNPFDVEHVAATWGGISLFGSRTGRPSGVPSFAQQVAWAGIDAALWDIIGKAKNTPVFRLLATGTPPQRRIRIYASGGVEYAWYKRPEALIEEAVRHKEAGYTAFKFRIGTDWKASGITIPKYIPYLRKMREAVGANFDLMQEANMRWTLEECLELCPALDELSFLWFEEPINRFGEGALEGHLKIRQALKRVKVSGGETMTSRFEFKPWIDRDAYDIVQPDCNTTGITEAWHIARMAHLKGKPCCPHNWHGGLTTMANAALVAGIPNRLMLELNQTYNPLKEEVFKEPLRVNRGYLELPEKPGFGVELAEDIFRKFPFIPGDYSRPNPDLPA
jgi:L-alanine-DL-glutamate epimerase-like enolase superfamily enzyme